MTLANQVGPDAMVTLTYTLYDEDGDVIDRTDRENALAYVHGYGQILPGLERALEGLTTGQTRSVVLAPGDGYGDYDDEGVFEIDRADFPDPAAVQVDDEFVAESPAGEVLSMRVVEVLEDGVVVDANHPLAGETLRFEVEVLDVRAATDTELAKAEHDFEERAAQEEAEASEEAEAAAAASQSPAGAEPTGLITIGTRGGTDRKAAAETAARPGPIPPHPKDPAKS